MKSSRPWFVVLRVLIPVAALWGWYAYMSSQGFVPLQAALPNLYAPGAATCLVFACLLMLVNWSAEAHKWQLLARPYHALSFWSALWAVWGGLAASMLSINRTGEFIGRALFLPKEKRLKGALASMTGSFAQSAATFAFGLPGFALLLFARGNPAELPAGLIIGGSLLLIGTMLLFVFRAEYIYFAFYRLFRRRKLLRLAAWSRLQSAPLLFRVLMFSFLRYAVFTLQFYLLSLVFGAGGGFLTAFMIISNVYLFSAFLPSLTLGEPAVRLFLAGFAAGGGGAMPYMVAVVLLWGINVGLPALAGAVVTAGAGFAPKPVK
jgi:hypothetical protein